MSINCKRVCEILLFPFFYRKGIGRQKHISMPVINMYNGDESSDDDDDDPDQDDESSCSAECQKLIRAADRLDDFGPEILKEEVDVDNLKMQCLERVRLIRDDLSDPSISSDEKRIDAINLNTMNTILTNIRFNEKIKLGSLQNSQYADAMILQKQVVCNFAGQREYGDLMKPVLQTQPQPSSMIAFSPSTEDGEIKSILKPPARERKNNISIPVASAE